MLALRWRPKAKNQGTTLASTSKRRSIRPPVRRKERPAAALLHATRDPIRKQELGSNRGNKSARARTNGITPLFTDREFIELMNRRAQALAQLPLRIALSRSPFEAWRHQNQIRAGYYKRLRVRDASPHEARRNVVPQVVQLNHFGLVVDATLRHNWCGVTASVAFARSNPGARRRCGKFPD